MPVLIRLWSTSTVDHTAVPYQISMLGFSCRLHLHRRDFSVRRAPMDHVHCLSYKKRKAKANSFIEYLLRHDYWSVIASWWLYLQPCHMIVTYVLASDNPSHCRPEFPLNSTGTMACCSAISTFYGFPVLPSSTTANDMGPYRSKAGYQQSSGR